MLRQAQHDIANTNCHGAVKINIMLKNAMLSKVKAFQKRKIQNKNLSQIGRGFIIFKFKLTISQKSHPQKHKLHLLHLDAIPEVYRSDTLLLLHILLQLEEPLF